MGDVEMQVPQKAEDVRMTTVFQKHPEGWQIIAYTCRKRRRDSSPRALSVRRGSFYRLKELPAQDPSRRCS